MELELTEEQAFFVETSRRFLQAECGIPAVRKLADDPVGYDPAVWARGAQLGWTSLLGHAPGGDDVSPYAAPARATDLGNLPRTYIATGALDLFVDEDIDYATRLIRAGVPVELHVYPGGYHAFDVFADGPVSQQARRDSHEALRRALA